MFDLHMRGAKKRTELRIDISNRQAYNTALLAVVASRGKLPAFERVFKAAPAKLKAGARQGAALQEGMLRALAAAWGAIA